MVASNLSLTTAPPVTTHCAEQDVYGVIKCIYFVLFRLFDGNMTQLVDYMGESESIGDFRMIDDFGMIGDEIHETESF